MTRNPLSGSLAGLGAAPTSKNTRSGCEVRPRQATPSCRNYLDETGQTADQLDISLVFNTNSGHQKIAETIQQMWKDNLGVDVKIVNQEWAVYLETVKSRDTRSSGASAGARTTRMPTTSSPTCSASMVLLTGGWRCPLRGINMVNDSVRIASEGSPVEPDWPLVPTCTLRRKRSCRGTKPRSSRSTGTPAFPPPSRTEPARSLCSAVLSMEKWDIDMSAK